jgi:type VII secretion integral membrane protein EccD
VPGLAAAGVAVVMLAAGALLSRAMGDGVAGAAAAGMGLPYAAAAGALFAAGDASSFGPDPGPLLVAGSALLFASSLGAALVGHGLRIFTAAGVVGLFTLVAALLLVALAGGSGIAGAAAIVVVILVAGIGLAPLLAVRLGRLPLPVVSASPQLIAGEQRPARPDVLAAVVRGDELLTGMLAGISITAVACVAVLTSRGGIAGPLLGGLAAGALLLRARLFPSVAARLPMLASGLIGLALTATAVAASSGSATRLIGVALAFVAVVALLGTAATAQRRQGGTSPYVGRLGDLLDVITVVALAPVACGVLNLFDWVRGLSS